MNLMPITHTIHYKSAFDIRGVGANALPKIREEIRNWLKSHPVTVVARTKLSQSWFDVGDTEQFLVGDGHIRVAVNKGEFSSINPQNWAIEFIHRDSSEPARLWCTEIGLGRHDDDSVRIACLLKHAVFEGWVGELPDSPDFSVPRFMKDIISKYDCYKENTSIQSDINQCLVGNTASLADMVLDVKRILPVVVSAPDSCGCDPVDLFQLQQIVMGNANVYYLPFERVDEFNNIVPQFLSLRPGMVRVYRQVYNSDTHSRRHRFFTKSRIEDIGSASLLEQIGVALSRNSRTFTTSEVVRIKDVIHVRSLHKIYELKKNALGHEKEYIALLEEENTKLAQQIDIKNGETNDLTEMYDDLDGELARAKAKIFNLEKGLNKQSNDIDYYLLSELPDDVYSCLKLASDIFNEKIIVHENAYDTARSFSGNDSQNCVRTVWRMLYVAATVLHPLVFSDKNYDLEKELLHRTGVDLSMTEGKLTKKDKSLTKMRTCEYKGEECTYFPHMKGKKSDGFLRIHFAFYYKEKKLLICHCGEHLDTAGTRKVN
jgi:hypothetical protein